MDIYEIRRANLQALIDARFEGKIAGLADAIDRSPSYVSRCLSKGQHRKRIGEEFARYVEATLKIEGGYLDKERHAAASSDGQSDAAHPTESGGTSPHERDYAIIPQLSARGQGGEGYLNEHVEVTGGLAFKRAWLAKMHVRPDDLSIIYAEGDSMEPWITQGDVVLIDHASIDPVSGQVFALRRPDGGVSIKRLVQQFSGQWRLSSDSSDKARHPNEDVDASSVSQVPIIGRVVWRGGAMT